MSAPPKPKDAMPAPSKSQEAASKIQEAGSAPTKPLRIDARTLAWLAEGADGTRDKRHVLYWDQKRVYLEPLSDANRDRAMLIVKTPSSVKKRAPRPATVRLEPEWDAVFLTESAMEKFLFPYYKAHRLLTEEDEQTLKDAYYDEKVIGVAHIAPSHSIMLFSDGSYKELIMDTAGVYPVTPQDLIAEPEGPK